MKKYVSGIVCAMLFLMPISEGFAQGPAASQSVPSTNSPQLNIAPSHVTAANELIKTTGLLRSLDTIIPDTMVQLKNNLSRARPELAEDLQQVLIKLKPDFMQWTNDLINSTARILASLMTEDDIRQTNAFFNSPAGQKFLKTQPVLLDQLGPTVQIWTQQTAENMMTRVRVEMKARGKDI